MHFFVEFCTEDPARYQLLFQRTIPGFEPSPESFAISVDGLETSASRLGAMGVTDPQVARPVHGASAPASPTSRSPTIPAATVGSGSSTTRSRCSSTHVHQTAPGAAEEGARDDHDRDTRSRRSRPITRDEARALAAAENAACRRPAPHARRPRTGRSRPTARVGRAATGRSHRSAAMEDFTLVPALVRRIDAAARPRRRPATARHRRHDRGAGRGARRPRPASELLSAGRPTAGPRAARWRATARRPCSAACRMKEEVGGAVETWRMGYLLDIILTRDTVDAPRRHRPRNRHASSCSPPSTTGASSPTSSPSGRDATAQPFTLTLTGPAGGTFVAGAGRRDDHDSTPSSSAASFPAAPTGPACSPRRCRSDGDPSRPRSPTASTSSRRTSPRWTSASTSTSSPATSRCCSTPASADVPARLRRAWRRSYRRSRCAGSRSATSRPTSPAR